MSSSKQIAQAYARAAFDYADQHNQIDAWDNYLQTLADVMAEPALLQLLRNPRIGARKFTDAMLAVLANNISAEQRNFFKLITENKRSGLLTAIAQEFSKLVAQKQNVQQVTVITAHTITDAQKEKFQQSLTKKLGKRVALILQTDPKILGGAIIRYGDQVMDGSIRGKLQELKQIW